MYRENEVLYLVMELMPGRNLKETWDELSEIEKVSICSQLGEAFTHIRSIPSPGLFGDVIGGPRPHSLFNHWRERDSRNNGPFKTTEELHLGIALHSRKQQELNDRHPWGSEWFARHLPQVLKDHPSTFTHSDLFKQNIMVQEQLVANNQTYQAV